MTKVVFDDVWDVREAKAFRTFGGRSARILTTRIPAVAQAFAPGEGTMTIGDLDLSEACALFQRLAPTALAYRPTIVEECLAEIGCLPLVVVIAALYLESAAEGGDPQNFERSVSRILDLRDVYHLDADIDDPLAPEATQRTLGAVIDLTASSLSKEHLAALRSLTAFPPKTNDFSWEAAEAVTTSRPAVAAVKGTGLIEQSHDLTRLTMHQTIHDYARQGVEGNDQAYNRMARYFINYIKHADQETGNKKQWVAALRPESSNITTALEYLVAQREAHLGLELMAALWDYWYRNGLYLRASTLADSLLKIEVQASSPEYLKLRALVLNAAGNFAFNMAELNAAEARHREAEAIRASLDDPDVAGSWNNLAIVFRERGKLESAKSLLQQALDRNRKDARHAWIGFNLDNLGIISMREGSSDAENLLRQSVEAWEKAEDDWGVAMAQIDLSRALTYKGSFDEAFELLIDLLPRRWKGDDLQQVAQILSVVAALYYETGELSTASTCLSGSLQLASENRHQLTAWHGLTRATIIAGARSDWRLVARTCGLRARVQDISELAVTERDSSRIDECQRAATAAIGESLYQAEALEGGEGIEVDTSGRLLGLRRAIQCVTEFCDVESLIARLIPSSE
jgi:tetratricopeptide (TPR) repeat protein